MMFYFVTAILIGTFPTTTLPNADINQARPDVSETWHEFKGWFDDVALSSLWMDQAV